MKLFSVTCAICVAAPALSAAALQDDFAKHIATFYPDVTSDSDEYARRFETFQENIEAAILIEAGEGSGATFTDFASSPFASTPQSLFAQQKRMRPRDVPASFVALQQPSVITDPVPDSWDWRDHGAVTTVKDQGALGTCWAFSTAANIEGQNFLNGNKKLTNFSVEQFVECDAFVDEAAGEADCGEFGGCVTTCWSPFSL